MKTFRLYSLCLLEKVNGEVQRNLVSIQEGLIISMENKAQTWFIEAVIPQEHLAYFEKLQSEERDLLVDVVITRKDNYPATMITQIAQITKLSEEISILLKANFVLKKDDVLDNVLEDLIEQGYTGEALMAEFKERKENLLAHSQKTLDEVYSNLQKSGNYQF